MQKRVDQLKYGDQLVGYGFVNAVIPSNPQLYVNVVGAGGTASFHWEGDRLVDVANEASQSAEQDASTESSILEGWWYVTDPAFYPIELHGRPCLFKTHGEAVAKAIEMSEREPGKEFYVAFQHSAIYTDLPVRQEAKVEHFQVRRG